MLITKLQLVLDLSFTLSCLQEEGALSVMGVSIKYIVLTDLQKIIISRNKCHIVWLLEGSVANYAVQFVQII